MFTYYVDFKHPYDRRIEINASSLEEAIDKFKNMGNYEIMRDSYDLDGLREPFELIEIFEYDLERDGADDYRYGWLFDPKTSKWVELGKNH
jgi:hypothetical protein